MRDDYLKLFTNNFVTILLDKSTDVFWITNKDYSVQIYVSPAFEQIWGYEAQALYEKPRFWVDTMVEEDRQRLASLSRLPHSCVLTTYQEKYRIIRKDGQIKWILDHTYPIFNNVEECIGYTGIAKDITSVMELEQELEIATQFLPKLAEKMERCAFWVLDPERKKQLYVSKGFEKIWERSTKFLYENPDSWLDTLVPEDRSPKVGSLLFVSDTKDPQISDTAYRIRRPSGEIRYIKDTSFPIYNNTTGALTGFAGIAEDVTEAKLYQIELEQAKEKAEAANVAKSNFIASVSHDFRTPLNGLLGMAEILRSRRCYPEQKEYIDYILQAGNTLLDLVEDIINFVALDLNKLPMNEEWFNLEKIVEEILLTISPQAHEKKVEVISNYSDMAPKKVYGDLNRVRRILMNLVNNAVKFTNIGHVLINVELYKKTKTKYWLQFIVEDVGIGISPENFDYIFGSFNKIDPSYRGRYKGTGLGLTIVKQFLEDLGGKIEIKSELNRGSIFYCTIPFTRHPHEIIPKVTDHYTNLRLLIVDDFRKRAVTFIKRFGFKNAEVANSETIFETIKAAAASNEPYELILIDDELKCNVRDLPKHIQKINPCILILITDKDSKQSLPKIKKMGYADCIMKPLQPLVVVNILENATVLYTPGIKGAEKSAKIKGRSVLLVEDDILSQKITHWMLEEFQCKVAIAGTGQEALGILEAPFDLIITDVGLPDMDGIQLATKIRAQKPLNHDTPIVALTAHVMEQDKEKCLAAGMNFFLKKPLFKKDLKKLLLKIFE